VPLDDDYSYEVGRNSTPANGVANGVVNGAEKRLSDNEMKIIACMSVEPSISKKRISEKTGIAARTVDRAISDLRGRNIIDRQGSDKTGVWVILDEHSSWTHFKLLSRNGIPNKALTTSPQAKAHLATLSRSYLATTGVPTAPKTNVCVFGAVRFFALSHSIFWTELMLASRFRVWYHLLSFFLWT